MSRACRPADALGRLATRSGVGHRRSGAAGGNRTAARRHAVRRSLALLVTGSGMLLAAAVLPSCSAAVRPPASGSQTTKPPAGVATIRLVGASGSAAWQLTATRLLVSWDAGQHWLAVALPARVAPSSITAITATAGRGMWLAVWRRPAMDLYNQRLGRTGWSERTLVPSLPSSLGFLGRQLPGVSITLRPANLVTVVADWGITSTAHYSTLFISSDGGTTFAQHPTRIGLFVSSDTFVSPQRGVIVAGPVNNDLYRTADGGASWVPVTIPGLPSGPAVSYLSYGTPGASGTQLLVPVTVTSSDGAQALSIYRSTDAGAAFAGPTGPPLSLPASLSAGDISPAISGTVLWLPARGRIYQTINAGMTWRTVMTAQSVYPISLISASQAIGTATYSGCRSFKTDCYNYSYLIATTDGGRSWRALVTPQATADTSLG
jgi:hypothetical protein